MTRICDLSPNIGRRKNTHQGSGNISKSSAVHLQIMERFIQRLDIGQSSRKTAVFGVHDDGFQGLFSEIPSPQRLGCSVRFHLRNDYLVPKEHLFGFETYDISSNSWRVLDITPEWNIDFYQRGVSLKGNTYFFAQDKVRYGWGLGLVVADIDDFLLCFDFTKERFRPCLPLPFHSYIEETVTLSCVREEQLAVLYKKFEILEIWVTTEIEPNTVSWSKFLKVDMRPLTVIGVEFDCEAGSFFIDEEEKVVVVFEVDGFEPLETAGYHKAFIIGDDGFKSMSLGEAQSVGKPDNFGNIIYPYCPPLVCSSSYHPSLVQINQPLKRKERED